MARQAIARFTDGLSGRLRSALPGVVIDDSDEERGRRDRVVDATIYLVAFAISAATLADTWQMHPPWLRVVDVVVGIATLVSLHWRRTHPAAVGIGVGAVSLVILTASGANLAATFNAAIRARGRDLAVIAGLLIAWALASPLLYPRAGSYWVNAGACLLVTGVVLGGGLFVRARRELVRSLRAQGDRAADEARAAERRRIAREMHDVLAHRLSLLSVHAGALEFHPDAPAEEVAEAAGVIRESAKTALEELRGVIGVLREDGGESLTQPPQPTLADLAALVEESRAAGMRVTARIELGEAVPPAAVGPTADRVAPEGPTSARKHAPGATAAPNVRAPGGAPTRLLAAQPDPPGVVVLTTFDADELVLRALQAGAAGFLLKDTPPAEIVRAIELVHAGDGMLSPAVTRRLISLVAGDSDAAARTDRARARVATLSPREHDVALAVARGQANAEIAAALHLSVPTVKAHVSRLLDKLDVDNRVQIALPVQEASGHY